MAPATIIDSVMSAAANNTASFFLNTPCNLLLYGETRQPRWTLYNATTVASRRC
jgi:hypothetical protein